MIGGIRVSVYAVAIILTLLPTLGAFYAVRSIIESAVGVGLNTNVSAELDKSGVRLKGLAKLDPGNESAYRAEFNKLQEVRGAYDLLVESSPALSKAYLQIFLIVLGGALMIAMAFAWWLNRRIIRSHDTAVREMKWAQERALYLENKESWRLFAQKLVHEVRNPLTPVQVMVGRLPQKYETLKNDASEDFSQMLEETKEMVNEEILKINNWIEAFSSYARMPEPRFVILDAKAFIQEFARQYGDYWVNLTVHLEFAADRELPIRIDPTLLKQVFFNLLKNSAEAAKGSALVLHIKIEREENGKTSFVFQDNGPGLSEQVRSRLFHPYVTSKGENCGMGLGLAIAKKVLLEHGGDIQAINVKTGCAFELVLPALGVVPASEGSKP